MPRSFQHSIALTLSISASIVCLCASALGADTGVDSDGPQRSRFSMKERVLQMTDFLDTMLPGTLGAKNITLHVSPKFTDVRDREFFRVPFEIRYGATNRLEFIGGISPFAPNPINTGRDHRWGPGEIKLGARYDLATPLPFFDKTTLGLENRIPLGKPPIQINDHYTHVRPFVAMSRRLRSLDSTTFYTNVSYDRSVKLTSREAPPPEVVRQHVIEVVPGLLYKPDEFGYFGEYRFRHIMEPIGAHLGHEVRVGWIWDVPIYRSAGWRLPGKWQAELGYKFAMEEGRSSGNGVFARVNWRTTLRQVLEHISPSDPRAR